MFVGTLIFLEKEDGPILISEMHAVILLIILEDLTKYYNNVPESTILATYAATPIQNDEGVLAGPLPKPLT